MAFVIGSDLGATWTTIGFHDVPLLLATKRAAALAGGDGQEPVGLYEASAQETEV